MPTNVFENPSFITNEGMRLLKNNLQFVRNLDTDFGHYFTETPKKGESISVRKQTRFVGRDGETFSAEGYTEKVCSMTVQETAGVDLQFSNRELMFNFERFSERVIAPAMQTLANKIESAALNLAITGTANTVGTPGTIPNTLKTYNQARAKMSWEGAPPEGHTLLINPDMQVEAVDAGRSLFNPSMVISKAFETGQLGSHYNAKVYECQNLYTHVVGAQGGTPLVNGTIADGATSVMIDGWTAAAATRLKKNDVITFTGVYAVNPWTRQTTNALRQFVVQADAASDGTGAMTVQILPAIVASGAFQNVTNVPADNTPVTVLGAANTVSPNGIRFHREAFLFASFNQILPGGVEIAKMATDPSTGLKLRFIRDWDTKNNVQINRYDLVWAFGTAFGELACRVAS